MSIKRNPNILDLINHELDRANPGGITGITSMQQYAGGFVVQYTHEYTSSLNGANVKEHRCAYLVLELVHSEPARVSRKWDMICS